MITIRTMKQEDKAQKDYIHSITWLETYAIQVQNQELSIQKIESYNQKNQTSIENHVVAEVNGRIVGFVSFGQNRDGIEETGEIYSLHVLRSHKNQDIEVMLLQEALSRLSHYKQVITWVLITDINKVAWFQQHGFTNNGSMRMLYFFEGHRTTEMLLSYYDGIDDEIINAYSRRRD